MIPKITLNHTFFRDSIGDGVVAGDVRWGGSFGVNVDYVARRY